MNHSVLCELREMAIGVMAQLSALSQRPSPAQAELLASTFDGAARVARRIACQLRQGGGR